MIVKNANLGFIFMNKFKGVHNVLLNIKFVKVKQKEYNVKEKIEKT